MALSQQPPLFNADDLAPLEGAVNGESINGNGQHATRQKGKAPLSNKQQLSAVIKSVRDLLRKDAGLSGDTDRLPQLTWLLFLKNLDDFEQMQEALLGEEYEPIVAEGYRWRDWVVDKSVTVRKKGDELLEFVNGQLIPHLQQLETQNSDLGAIIRTIFQGTVNRQRSGYLLREVVDKLDNINFNSSDDIHAVSLFYETMLKEMRDAAGDSGEFYTPRPVVRFIIDRLKPQLGERVLDPACGTGGFLVETYERLKDAPQTPDQVRELYENIMGIEKKAMPYLLGVMNLLLHGIATPNLQEKNALAENIRHIAADTRVDVIATNPPFGGEEESAILTNFPEGLRASETTLLFFQYIMAMLKRPGGRCGLVLPNGFLFGNGVAATIKKRLLNQFNLHTIVRLPRGTFAPYTDIPTNILFFDACNELDELAEKPCTNEVWYYELPLPEGRRSYTKTRPLQFEDFTDCITWWNNRIETQQAWKVPVAELLANDYNLDRKNPNGKKDIEHLPPKQLIEDILRKESQIVKIIEEIQQQLGDLSI